MNIKFGTLTGQFAFGIYLSNWGYPIKHQWEIGLYLGKWYVGIAFFKDEE
jgi:hypothetical protein